MTDLGNLANRMSSTSTPADTSGSTRRPPPPPRRTTTAKSEKETAPPSDSDANVTDETASQTDAAAATPPREVTTTSAKTVETYTTRRSGTEPAASFMASKQEAGSVVQVRVQPPDVGVWFNLLCEAGQFAFDGRAGDIAGAILLVAQAHEDEIVALLEDWGGEPQGFARRAAWNAYLAEYEARQPRVVEGE